MIYWIYLTQAMEKSDQNKFLIDGFPRNKDNLDGWQKEMGDKTNVQFVLFFNCSQEVCRSYSVLWHSYVIIAILHQTCMDRCLQRGAAGSGRSDDNEESLKKRFQTYVKDTMAIIEYYEALGLVRKIDASQSPDQVFEDVKKAFE